MEVEGTVMEVEGTATVEKSAADTGMVAGKLLVAAL